MLPYGLAPTLTPSLSSNEILKNSCSRTPCIIDLFLFVEGAAPSVMHYVVFLFWANLGGFLGWIVATALINQSPF